ncbi:MAG TPA: hypothetical protein VHH36_08645, partial [Candidatus Thermoplasmatota archaeon]|nr:hypothetical protein [Candidatus Thermoplasmatota archaeon]
PIDWSTEVCVHAPSGEAIACAGGLDPLAWREAALVLAPAAADGTYRVHVATFADDLEHRLTVETLALPAQATFPPAPGSLP